MMILIFAVKLHFPYGKSKYFATGKYLENSDSTVIFCKTKCWPAGHRAII